MSADIRVDVSRARSGAVGAAHGITPGELRDLAPEIRRAHRALREDRRKKRYGFYDLYKDRDMVAKVQETAKIFRGKNYDNLVVLGIGGSALGLSTLVTALKPPYYNLLSRESREGHPRVFVMDNVDPRTFAQMLELCPPKNTLFNVISKSGGTAETVSQMLVVLDRLESELGKSSVKDHLVVTTGPKARGKQPNPLHEAKERYGLRSLTVPTNVGGRFSIFSSVGLFPAAILGIDIRELLAGCRAMDKRTSRESLKDNPAYLRAAFHYLAFTNKGKRSSVMMPYADALGDVADWYCQLWAESLGKNTALNGKALSEPVGQTPIKALGATDQHSQLQLYLEGPNDKIITLLHAKRLGNSLRIPRAMPSRKDLAYLQGSTMNKLLDSEYRATADALHAAQRPVIRVTLPEVTAHTVGQLLYMLEIETAMAGRLFGVNAFDQPGVEAIKVFARKYMGTKR